MIQLTAILCIICMLGAGYYLSLHDDDVISIVLGGIAGGLCACGILIGLVLLVTLALGIRI